MDKISILDKQTGVLKLLLYIYGQEVPKQTMQIIQGTDINSQTAYRAINALEQLRLITHTIRNYPYTKYYWLTSKGLKVASIVKQLNEELELEGDNDVDIDHSESSELEPFKVPS